MRLRATAGQRGGPESPRSEITHEGEQKDSRACHHHTHLFLILRYLHSAQRCFCQLLFLLLLLMVNYQDGVEQRQGRLLRSAVSRTLRSAPRGLRNLTSLRE